jgi:thioredoxin reductase (NADPH)
MLIRANDLLPMMSSYLADRIRAIPNIDVVCSVEVACVNGNGSLHSVVVKSVTTGAERVIPCVAMFVFIGVKPHTDAFAGVVERDEQGFVVTGVDLPKEHGRPRGWTLERDPFMFETSIPGVFAAGDVRAGANRRVAAAVGEGSAAIYSVHRYLRTV